MNDDLLELSRSLHAAVDDHQVPAPDLLPAARRIRTRRRIGMATAGAAVLVATVVAVTQTLPRMAVTPDVAGSPSVATPSLPVATPTPSTSAVLSATEIVRRCAPQMVKYDALPQFGRMANTWQVAHTSHAYRVGDIVALLPATESVYPAYCRIPEADRIGADVPFASLEPAALDATSRVAMCSESMRTYPLPQTTRPRAEPTADYSTPDVRDATIALSETAGKMMMVALKKGTAAYICTLFPQEWDFGGVSMNTVGTTASLDVGMSGSAAGASAKSLVPGPATYYYGAGLLPANARTVEFFVRGQLVHSVSAASDGLWVAAFMIDGRNSLSDPATWTIKDAAGTVLKTGSLNG